MIVPLVFITIAAVIFLGDYFFPPNGVALQGAEVSLRPTRFFVDAMDAGIVDRMLGRLGTAGHEALVPYVESALSISAVHLLLAIAVITAVISMLVRTQRRVFSLEERGDNRKQRIANARQEIARQGFGDEDVSMESSMMSLAGSRTSSFNDEIIQRARRSATSAHEPASAKRGMRR